MSNHITNKVLIVGAGPMGVAHAKVLIALKQEFVAVGRGQASSEKFLEETGYSAVMGGIDKWIAELDQSSKPSHAIVAVPVSNLTETCISLSEIGVNNILVEKPAGLDEEQLALLTDASTKNKTTIRVAYNRRYLSSVLRAQEIIKEDGGVTSFNFEFTEWGHIIGKLDKSAKELDSWFLANSTHVVDLAFYLGGRPEVLHSIVQGSMDWHTKASRFAGCGVTADKATFSYQANWDAPGRWVLEVLTAKHRLIFKPLEKLQIQKKGAVAVDFVDVDDHLDVEYKPGLYKQDEDFLSGESSQLPSIQDQLEMVNRVYSKMVENHSIIKNKNC